MFEGLLQVEVSERGVDMQKGCIVSHLQNVLAKSRKKINNPSQPGEASKRDQPFALFVGDPLLVDQANIRFQHVIQRRHVDLLGLDDVREEQLSAIW